MITNDTKQEIKKILKECCDEYYYDVILISNNIFDDISQINLRYLNYFNRNNEEVNISLKNPENLHSVSLYNVTVSNLKDCKNLKNLRS